MYFYKSSLWLLIFYSVFGGVAAAEYSDFDLDESDLVSIAFDGFRSHEAYPAGVPSSYDWAKGPRVGAGNNPDGFEAATGWGQVFYKKDSSFSQMSSFEIKNFRTFLCTRSDHGMEWSLVQRGPIVGGEFNADFSGNISRVPPFFVRNGDVAEIQFNVGGAFHFWPEMGRIDLLSQKLCGFLVYLEARQTKGDPKTVLLGLGADYWLTRSAPWDNYKTNKDVAIGRLKILTADWRIIGLTTATGDALRLLKDVGYIVRVPN